MEKTTRKLGYECYPHQRKLIAIVAKRSTGMMEIPFFDRISPCQDSDVNTTEVATAIAVNIQVTSKGQQDAL